MREPQEGRYAISEVGDLGMGLTPINEENEEVTEEKKEDLI